MSWLFSRALVEAYSEATSSDGARSALLSGSPTPQAFLPPDRMTAFSRPSRSGMTFRPLTADLGEAVLMWCQEASRAKTSAWPARERALTGPAAECGDTWRGSLAKFDPATSSWRTAQPSLLEDLGESSVTWPRSGMTAAGQCWELPMLGRRTDATDSGLWPTPRAQEPGRTTVGYGRGLAELVEGKEQVQKWPTPAATDHLWNSSERLDSWQARAAKKKAEGVNLQFALRHAVQMWPTPTVCGNYNRKGASATSGDGLATAVLKFPTPSTLGINGGSHSQAAAVKRGQAVTEVNGGSLNPTWVEWLMGWPLGWTDLKPLATDKCPSALPLPGGF